MGDYREGDWPKGEPLLSDDERTAIAKTLVPEPEPALADFEMGNE